MVDLRLVRDKATPIGVARKAVVSLHLGVWQGGNNSVVECDLAKVEVAGSNPVSRSNFYWRGPLHPA